MGHARIISLHSWQKNVGKTTLALSISLQLAAVGKRVALLDFAVQGSCLSQLPLDASSSLYWNSCFNMVDEKLSPSEMCGIGRQLVFLNTDCADLDKVSSRLRIWPASPSAKDRVEVEKWQFMADWKTSYRKILMDIYQGLDRMGYDFIIVDNAAGSLSASGTFAWIMELARKKKAPIQVLFLTGNVPEQAGALLYDISAFRSNLKTVHQTIVMLSEFSIKDVPESAFLSDVAHEQRQALSEIFFSSQCWQGLGLNASELWSTFMTPLGINWLKLSQYRLPSVISSESIKGILQQAKNKQSFQAQVAKHIVNPLMGVIR